MELVGLEVVLEPCVVGVVVIVYCILYIVYCILLLLLRLRLFPMRVVGFVVSLVVVLAILFFVKARHSMLVLFGFGRDGFD